MVFCHRHLLQSSNREIYWGTTMCQIQNSLGDEADGSIVCWRTNVSLMIWLCQAEVLPLTCCLHHGLAANLLVMTVLLLHRVVLFCWSHTFPNSFFGWGCLRCSGNHGKLCAPMHSCSLIWLLMMISTTLLWWGSHPTGPKSKQLGVVTLTTCGDSKRLSCSVYDCSLLGIANFASIRAFFDHTTHR